MNWLGLWTLYTKEVKRFWRVGPQTLLAPVVSNLLYLTVFVLAFSENRAGGAEGFIAFLIPGLIMLGILNNSSANSSSSLMTGKMMGSCHFYRLCTVHFWANVARSLVGRALLRHICGGDDGHGWYAIRNLGREV